MGQRGPVALFSGVLPHSHSTLGEEGEGEGWREFVGVGSELQMNEPLLVLLDYTPFSHHINTLAHVQYITMHVALLWTVENTHTNKQSSNRQDYTCPQTAMGRQPSILHYPLVIFVVSQPLRVYLLVRESMEGTPMCVCVCVCVCVKGKCIVCTWQCYVCHVMCVLGWRV